MSDNFLNPFFIALSPAVKKKERFFQSSFLTLLPDPFSQVVIIDKHTLVHRSWFRTLLELDISEGATVQVVPKGIWTMLFGIADIQIHMAGSSTSYSLKSIRKATRFRSSVAYCQMSTTQQQSEDIAHNCKHLVAQILGAVILAIWFSIIGFWAVKFAVSEPIEPFKLYLASVYMFAALYFFFVVLKLFTLARVCTTRCLGTWAKIEES
jgi:hypothetical protein